MKKKETFTVEELIREGQIKTGSNVETKSENLKPSIVLNKEDVENAKTLSNGFENMKHENKITQIANGTKETVKKGGTKIKNLAVNTKAFASRNSKRLIASGVVAAGLIITIASCNSSCSKKNNEVPVETTNSIVTESPEETSAPVTTKEEEKTIDESQYAAIDNVSKKQIFELSDAIYDDFEKAGIQSDKATMNSFVFTLNYSQMNPSTIKDLFEMGYITADYQSDYATALSEIITNNTNYCLDQAKEFINIENYIQNKNNKEAAKLMSDTTLAISGATSYTEARTAYEKLCEYIQYVDKDKTLTDFEKTTLFDGIYAPIIDVVGMIRYNEEFSANIYSYQEDCQKTLTK